MKGKEIDKKILSLTHRDSDERIFDFIITAQEWWMNEVSLTYTYKGTRISHNGAYIPTAEKLKERGIQNLLNEGETASLIVFIINEDTLFSDEYKPFLITLNTLSKEKSALDFFAKFVTTILPVDDTEKTRDKILAELKKEYPYLYARLKSNQGFEVNTKPYHFDKLAKGVQDILTSRIIS